MPLHTLSGLTYELVVSRRAKRASLRVVPGRGLIVSVPIRFARSKVAGFIESNRAWIETSLADLEAKTLPRFRQWPPRELLLHAINTRLTISYAYLGECELEPQAHDDWLSVHRCVTSATHDKAAVADEIAAHLKAVARLHLPPLLASYAHLHGFRYQRVSIRGQRTVWGSYSSSGTLSLNYKLLFLTRELLDYVLLHELAHTVHLDHSEAFWQLLRSVSINARHLDRQLAGAGPQVPPWLELAK